MDPLTLITVFGPIVAQLIPQVSKLFGGAKDKANMAVASTVLDTIVSATGAPNVQAAVEAMQSDPVALKKATDAVVTHPDIQPSLQIVEVGGGSKAAAERDTTARAEEKPFYKTSAVFWISVILLPMVLWYVGSSIAGGVGIPSDWPWYAQLPLKLFGREWDPGARVGLANLVVGLVLGGICGVFFGVSVTQAKQAASQSAGDKPTT